MVKMEEKYDLIVVGSGIFGLTVAYNAQKAGKKVLVLEKRWHKGGNIYDYDVDGLRIHMYGAHIFHTSNEEVWKFVNQFAKFNNYVHHVIANNKNKLYHLPFSLDTFIDVYQQYITIDLSREILKECREKEYYENPKNLEEYAINQVGRKIYEALIRDYTEKQWNKPCKDLPADLIKRLPIRETFSNRYFNDKYEGIPEDGYEGLIKNLSKDLEIKTKVDFNENPEYWISKADKILYTGQVDDLCKYSLGELGYRSLIFQNSIIEKKNFQGIAVMNYTGKEVPYTRTIESKYFYWDKMKDHPYTSVMYEFPDSWSRGKEAYYPINTKENQDLYEKYVELVKKEFNGKVILGGRLGLYKYFDMDDAIAEALKMKI